jgi:hypothetical protein
MPLSTKNPLGQTPATGPLWYAVLVAAALLVTGWASATDDSYLQMLDEEATKVDGVVTDKESQRETATSDSAKTAGEAKVSSRVAFENLLREQHVGTYSFYRRLPERSREEVFLDFSRGASMESLRGKIVDRYLHP